MEVRLVACSGWLLALNGGGSLLPWRMVFCQAHLTSTAPSVPSIVDHMMLAPVASMCCSKFLLQIFSQYLGPQVMLEH